MAQRSASPELLAPAGSIEALKLAVNAGADAVYFGVGDFHARRAAAGIDLVKAVEYCHLFGAKAYLTLNIAIKNAEFSNLTRLVEAAYKAKIDAFIVADLGIVSMLNAHAPGVPLHASTQLGIAAKEGAELLKQLGFSRVVLAREAGLEEVRAIKSIGLEVEYFVHGALCVAFSGSCYLSSVKSGDSGNRGLCKQPCRLPYRMKIGHSEKPTAYYLSPKDQCLIAHLQELKEAGVDSFKIEGRLKRDVYAGGVCNVYRRAIDGEPIESEDISDLKRLFNRGEFTEGYFFDKKRQIIYPNVQSHIGEFVAKIEAVRNGKAYFRSDETLINADGFKILRGGKEADVTLGALEQEKEGYSFRSEGVRAGDEVRITNDVSLNDKLLSLKRKLRVSIRCVALCGKPLRIEMQYRTLSAAAEGEITQAAKTTITAKEEIRASLKKLGNTVFEAGEIFIESDNVFLPKSKLNELRRLACEKLKEKILIENSPRYQARSEAAFPKKSKLKGVFSEVESVEKAFALPDSENSHIVFRPSEYRSDVAVEFIQKFRNERKTQKIFLFTPPMILERDADSLRNMITMFDGIVANSLTAVGLALKEQKLLVLGQNLNIANRSYPLIPMADAYLVSVELNEQERRDFSDGTLYAYGRLPLMYFRHCPKTSANISCKDCKKEDKIVLSDGKYDFPLERFSVSDECRFRLLNSVNTDLGMAAKNRNLYLDFGSTSSEDIPKIYREYCNGERKSQGEYTLLHTKRGVL